MAFNKFCNQSLTITPRYGKIICPVIFSQIIMVSPGTHLVKNRESLSITNGSQFN